MPLKTVIDIEELNPDSPKFDPNKIYLHEDVTGGTKSLGSNLTLADVLDTARELYASLSGKPRPADVSTRAWDPTGPVTNLAGLKTYLPNWHTNTVEVRAFAADKNTNLEVCARAEVDIVLVRGDGT